MSQYLEALGEDNKDKQKSEYSLTQHLANNLIDMYINLPSKNHYRRPASYASKGYHSRRMAVDFAVPLITNVKNAKMLAEALVRKLPLDVSTIDSKSSHQTHVFPGLVNVSAFVPDLAILDSQDLVEATEASVAAGFTTAIVIPIGVDSKITDAASMDLVRANIKGVAHCNFALNVCATKQNIGSITEELQSEAKALFIPFQVDNISFSLSTVASHFTSWPSEKPIITNAKGSDLASILLLASLHNRSVHVTDVTTSDDLLLISLSKAKHLKVTCDVSIYSLFFNTSQYPTATCLPTADDQKSIWSHIEHVDVFSVGATPYRLAVELGHSASAKSGLEEALPLLLTAVSERRLTLEDIVVRLHDNPILIFGLPDQVLTEVEVVIGRTSTFVQKARVWSPLQKVSVTGAVHRVVVHGQTSFLDGASTSLPSGREISGATVSHAPSASLASSSPHLIGTEGMSLAGTVSLALGPPAHAPHVPPQQSLIQGPPALNIFSHLFPHPAFHRRHILSVKQFTHRDMHDLFSLAHEMRLQVERYGSLDILKGKVLCTAFYEPSTRTSSSFDAAMKRCGGQVVQITAETSSVQKGESLPDTIRTLACYGDAIVIRHPDVGSAQLAAKYSPVPVINAGDGIGEHPTQVCFFVYFGSFV